jgi:hypothetical protein
LCKAGAAKKKSRNATGIPITIAYVRGGSPVVLSDDERSARLFVHITETQKFNTAGRPTAALDRFPHMGTRCCGYALSYA